MGHSGSMRTWELVELRRCRLSPQAMLINILRCKLQGRPMAEAFKDVALLKEAAAEAKAATRQMQLLDAFRVLKAKKDRIAAENRRAGSGEPIEKAASVPKEAARVEGKEAKPDHDPRRQPFCWVYVLRK